MIYRGLAVVGDRVLVLREVEIDLLGEFRVGLDLVVRLLYDVVAGGAYSDERTVIRVRVGEGADTRELRRDLVA